MPFMDKVKQGAAQAAQKAQQAAKAGQAKIDEAKAKREQDAMFRDLGAAVYAQRSGTADSNTSSEIDRLVAALKDHEAAAGRGRGGRGVAGRAARPGPDDRGRFQARRLSPLIKKARPWPGFFDQRLRSALDDDDRSGR